MRRAGILLPLSSLPSPYGVGTMGAAARAFIDFLAAAGQSCWQLLPVGPTGYGDSPYQSFSSYAGSPYFIDLDELAQEGLLKPEEYQSLDWGADPAAVDYALLYRRRYPVLRAACRRLLARPGAEFQDFCTREAHWLDDYALFMALKDDQGGKSWFQWPRPLRLRRPAALAAARKRLGEDVAFWQGVQFLFFRQFRAMKDYANAKGITLIGDLPIYVAGDSADVWAAPDQFQLDENGRPTQVAGVPPDAFSEDGQLWGNPLFRWDRMAQDGYRWWLARIAAQFRLYDTLRIDHFRGFDAYYAIPYGEKTARNGRWRPGPGAAFFRAVNAALGPRDIIAEDLGFLTPSVHALRQETGYPGMKILEFAFDDRQNGSDYLPHCYDRRCVVYAGTHDNDTIQGWMATVPRKTAAFARDYLRLSKREGYHWGVMRGGWASPADLAVMQMQDILGLGSEARMNTPSTLGNNWQWRMLPGACTPALAQKLRRTMQTFQRLPEQNRPCEPESECESKGEPSRWN